MKWGYRKHTEWHADEGLLKSWALGMNGLADKQIVQDSGIS